MATYTDLVCITNASVVIEEHDDCFTIQIEEDELEKSPEDLPKIRRELFAMIGDQVSNCQVVNEKLFVPAKTLRFWELVRMMHCAFNGTS